MVWESTLEEAGAAEVRRGRRRVRISGEMCMVDIVVGVIGMGVEVVAFLRSRFWFGK